jgi:hypothetical protein
LEFPLYFDNKNEYFPIGDEIHSFPLGTAFIDFLEFDFIQRDFSNPDILDNPFTRIFKNLEDIETHITEIGGLLGNYHVLVDHVLDSDHVLFKEVNALTRYCLFQNKIPVPVDRIEVTHFCSTNGVEFNNTSDFAQLKNTVKELQKLELTMIEIYYVKSIEEALYISFIKMVTNNVMVKKCKCCNKFFIPGGRSDTEYCNRIAPDSSKTCREVGAIKKYHEKSNNNPIMKEFQREYKKMNSRVRIKKITQTNFYDWSEKARALRDRAINENMELDIFKKLLKELEV